MDMFVPHSSTLPSQAPSNFPGKPGMIAIDAVSAHEIAMQYHSCHISKVL